MSVGEWVIVLQEQQAYINGIRKASNYFIYLLNTKTMNSVVLWRFFPEDQGRSFDTMENEASVAHVEAMIKPLIAVLGVPVERQTSKIQMQSAIASAEIGKLS